MKKNWRITLLLSAFLFACSFLQAQISPELKKFVGLWKSEETSCRLVFYFDKNDKLKIVGWDSKDGEQLEVVEIKIEGTRVKVTEKFNSTNHVTTNTYFLSGENTLKDMINGDANANISFTRVQ